MLEGRLYIKSFLTYIEMVNNLSVRYYQYIYIYIYIYIKYSREMYQNLSEQASKRVYGPK